MSARFTKAVIEHKPERFTILGMVCHDDGTAYVRIGNAKGLFYETKEKLDYDGDLEAQAREMWERVERHVR